MAFIFALQEIIGKAQRTSKAPGRRLLKKGSPESSGSPGASRSAEGGAVVGGRGGKGRERQIPPSFEGIDLRDRVMSESIEAFIMG